jgi:hypothetical protein
MNAQGTVSIIRINPDIENERKAHNYRKFHPFHFQSSAQSAKKSIDFFGLKASSGIVLAKWNCIFDL